MIDNVESVDVLQEAMVVPEDIIVPREGVKFDDPNHLIKTKLLRRKTPEESAKDFNKLLIKVKENFKMFDNDFHNRLISLDKSAAETLKIALAEMEKDVTDLIAIEAGSPERHPHEKRILAAGIALRLPEVLEFAKESGVDVDESQFPLPLEFDPKEQERLLTEAIAREKHTKGSGFVKYGSDLDPIESQTDPV